MRNARVSDVALGILRQRAQAASLRVRTTATDLIGTGTRDADPFQLVVVADFLDRPLWSRLWELVVPGGHVIVRTFTASWPGEKPPARYRLEPGELAEGLPGLTELAYEESGGRAGWSGLRDDD